VVVERTVTLRTGQTLATRLGDGLLTVLATLVLVATNLVSRKLESLNSRLVASSAENGVQ
jgi:hypothetical protein